MPQFLRQLRSKIRSPLQRRILAINLLVLLIPLVGYFFLAGYKSSLIEQEISALATKGEMMAKALSLSAITQNSVGDFELRPEGAKFLVRSISSETQDLRIRLFHPSGIAVADNFNLLPSPQNPERLWIEDKLQALSQHIGDSNNYPAYVVDADARAESFPALGRAFSGDVASQINLHEGQTTVSVAVPVFKGNQNVGAVFISNMDQGIDSRVFDLQIKGLWFFLIAFTTSLLLSLYLGRHLVKPLTSLRNATQKFRANPAAPIHAPKMRRNDEISDLSHDFIHMAQDIQQRIQVMEKFAGDVAHELKNPLASLSSSFQTLELIHQPDDRAELKKIIHYNLQRMDQLISDILSSSRLDVELAQKKWEVIDLHVLMPELIASMRSHPKAKDFRITLDLPKAPLKIHGLSSRWAQVIDNIISNAMSFSPKNSEISVRIYAQDQEVMTIIEDQGPGIQPNKLETIFERFYSDRPKSVGQQSYSGLGLSICQQIIHGFGGQIWAENRPEGGARFIISLPAVRA